MTVVADHDAAAQLDHAALHLVDESGLVGGHHDGRAAGVDAGQQLHDVHRRGGVEVAGRLVGEEDLRAVDERAGDRDALLLTAGELVRQSLLLAVQADQGEHLRDRLLDERAGRADDLQRERDVLEDRLVRQQAEILEHRADVAAEVGDLPGGEGPQISPEHHDTAVARIVFAEDQPQAGGLPRTGRADEEDELSALHLEVDVAQRRLAGPAVFLGDVLEPDHDLSSLSAAAADAGCDTPGALVRRNLRDQSSSSLRLRQRMPAAIRPSRSPSNTTAGLPTSYPVRRSLTSCWP